MNRTIIGIMVLIGIIMFVWWQQKQPPQQVPYTYAPRIGDDPSEPEVDGDHIRFQISTQVTTQDQPPQSAPGIGFVQEVTSREELSQRETKEGPHTRRHEARSSRWWPRMRGSIRIW